MLGRRRRRRSRGSTVAPVDDRALEVPPLDPDASTPGTDPANGRSRRGNDARDLRFQRLVADDEPDRPTRLSGTGPQPPSPVAPNPSVAIPGSRPSVTRDEHLRENVTKSLTAGAALIDARAEAAALTVENASDQLARAAADHLTHVLQVTAQFDSALAAHRERSDNAAAELEQIADARVANLVRTGQAVTEQIEHAAADATARIQAATAAARAQLEQTETELRGRLEHVAGRATLMRRLTLVALVIVGVVAVVGLVIAATGSTGP
jgi:hypothetical protein